MTKVSIVTPVYNSSAFLDKSIQSIMDQSYTEWELILVNNGSSDESGIICDKYALIDNRIKVYHKNLGGVSSARNYGIERANGSKLVFMDSDDYVSKYWLEHLMIDETADLVVTGYVIHEGMHIYESIPEVVESIPDLIGSLGSSMTLGWCCRLCFTRKIIEDNTIRFNDDYKVLEDECFVSEYLKYVNSVVVNPVADYHYIKAEYLDKYNDKWNDDVYFDIAPNIFYSLDKHNGIDFKDPEKISQVKKYYLVAMYKSFIRELKKHSSTKTIKYYESLCQFSDEWRTYPKILFFQRWIFPLFRLIIPYFPNKV